MDFIANPTFQAFLIATLMAVVLWLGVARKMLKSRNFGNMSLEETMQANEGYTIKEAGTDDFLGETGTTFTDMNISGKIDVKGQRFDAITRGEFIEKGESIRVIENRGNYFVIERIAQLT